MGMSSQKENTEARWWVSLICVCQVLRSQHVERKARADLSTAAVMAPRLADRLLPGVHLGCLARALCHTQRSGYPIAPHFRVPTSEREIKLGPAPT